MVCGDRLCSELEPTPHASSWSRQTPPVPVQPAIDIEEAINEILKNRNN